MDRLRDYFKCYDPRFFAWVWAGVGVLFAASFGGLAFERGSIGRFVCAAIQAGAMTPLILAMIVRLRYLDELQRRIQLEAIAVAFAVGIAAIMSWGYFEHAGAPRVDWGLCVVPLFIGTWFVALFVIRRRYQ